MEFAIFVAVALLLSCGVSSFAYLLATGCIGIFAIWNIWAWRLVLSHLGRFIFASAASVGFGYLTGWLYDQTDPRHFLFDPIKAGCFTLLGSWPIIPTVLKAAKKEFWDEKELKRKVAEVMPSKSKDIYLCRNGETIGPFSQLDLQFSMMEGTVASNELAWMEGETDWKPLIHLVFNGTKS